MVAAGSKRNRDALQSQRRHSLDSEDEDEDEERNCSPTTAMRWDRTNYKNQDDSEEGSRRSSLQSSSIVGIEGEETPGPAHTPFPLEAVAGAEKSSSFEGKKILCCRIKEVLL